MSIKLPYKIIKECNFSKVYVRLPVMRRVKQTLGKSPIFSQIIVKISIAKKIK